MFVEKRNKSFPTKCGQMDITDTNKDLYTIQCDNVCGNVIRLEVNHKTGNDYEACIHMFEIEAYTGSECPAGYFLKENVCEPCSEGEYSAGGKETKCKKCPEGLTSLPAAARLSDCKYFSITLKFNDLVFCKLRSITKILINPILIDQNSIGLPKAQPTSASQSSTLQGLNAKLATDGELKTLSHTKCGNSPIWYRMDFQFKYCFKSFKIHQAQDHNQNSRQRMAGAGLFVKDTNGENSEQLCDMIELSRVREKLPLILECPNALCGNSVELRIEKENGCIHMREIESYRINCREKSIYRNTDGVGVCAGKITSLTSCSNLF